MAKPVGEVVAHCPKCGKSIGDQNLYAWCTECGEALTPESKANIPLLAQQEQVAQEKQSRARASALSTRYNDAYLVAKVAVGSGNTIKIIGFILAGLILLGTSRLFGFLISLIISFFVGFIFHIIGIMVSAHGQVLKATLDNTVGNSPFLTDDLKAKIMTLPEA